MGVYFYFYYYYRDGMELYDFDEIWLILFRGIFYSSSKGLGFSFSDNHWKGYTIGRGPNFLGNDFPREEVAKQRCMSLGRDGKGE
jgi:hypothetical protein